jgi:acyl-CoA thioesterase
MTAGSEDPNEATESVNLEIYGTDEASEALGIKIDDVGPGRATARLTIQDHMVNGHGSAHGGFIFLLADIAFAVACNTEVASIGRSCSIEYLAPGHVGDRLVAEAKERFRDSRNGIYDVTVRRESDGVVLAELRGHSRTMRQRF